ncbi:C4-dicarboxylate transport system substrate-binding protein [Alkalihalophilus pseudofirmus OF4]|uniref:C4-dicarboxylate transport system substrate-binding protein n=1 Tax=Alkalihalophilus pseudofirmus (strain ATCC BAA-2126 / JCM 17055 / OF4) TaxID=398511 RepID=D3FZT7_ALKPO|nr:TRAP transporter substrate-binding protein [Alkalihalophilus pseudofirmus]ADC49329.1 C4-dicarboxylate transport system substrate-binding protein [Alkalihalophilus pseudofirmus OF4]
MKKWLPKVSLAVAIALGLGACGSASEDTSSTNEGTGGDAQAQTETQTITFSLDQPASHIWVKATNKFAELVEEKTDGSLIVEVHDSASLGTQREALEGMKIGTMGGTVSLEPVSGWVEEIGIFGVPYLFEDENHLNNFLTSESGEELNELMIEEGFKPLTYFMRAPRQISSNKKIESVDDLRGLNIRVPESPTAPPAFEEMGARVVTLPISEVYSALQQNVIDAQENPITQIYSDKFYEVQDYITLSNHQYQAAYLLISNDIYEGLTDEQKAALEEAAEETKQIEHELHAEELEAAYAGLEEVGVEIVEVDSAPFAEAASQAYEGYDELMQTWIEKVRSSK